MAKRIKQDSHGMSQTSVYRIWLHMKKRCTNPNHIAYKHYGGKGVKICDAWFNSFMAFYKDMGDRPSEDHSIDRIDPDGNYCKENCRWILKRENARLGFATSLDAYKANGIRYLRHCGVPIQVIADRYGINSSTVSKVALGKRWTELAGSY